MSGEPPQLRDQAAVRSGLRVGGAIVAGIGLILAIAGFADFFSAFGSASMPTHFWMAFIGLPMLGIGGRMLQVGFLGTATRYAAGEVMPTVKDSLSYVGIGTEQAICAKCGEANQRRREILRPLRGRAQHQLPLVRARQPSRLRVLQ